MDVCVVQQGQKTKARTKKTKTKIQLTARQFFSSAQRPHQP
jgi:hypothetical protein